MTEITTARSERYVAWVVTADMENGEGEPAGIMIQGYDLDEQTQIPTGEEIYVETDDLADLNAATEALHAAGWELRWDGTQRAFWEDCGNAAAAQVERIA